MKSKMNGAVRSTAIIGGGMMGNAIAAKLTAHGVPVQILKGFSRHDGPTLPKEVRQIIFTAQSRDSQSPIPTDDLTFVNVELVDRIARDAISIGVTHFCFMSSGGVYAASDCPLSEHDPLEFENPSPYAATKIAAETLLRAHSRQFNSLVILRPFFIYGPGIAPDRLLARIVATLRAGRPIKLAGGRGMIFNPIHSSDVARFTLHALDNTNGVAVMNAAGTETTGLNDIAGILARHMNVRPEYELVDAPPVHLIGDIRAMSRIGFKHEISLAAGLADLAALSA